MIKLNAPTHELEKSNFGDKKKTPCFQESIKMGRFYMFKLVMVVSNSTSPLEVWNKIESAYMC
jgi:hypothetical protein